MGSKFYIIQQSSAQSLSGCIILSILSTTEINLHRSGLAEEFRELGLGGLEGQVSNKDLMAILLDVNLGGGCGILAHGVGTGRTGELGGAGDGGRKWDAGGGNRSKRAGGTGENREIREKKKEERKEKKLFQGGQPTHDDDDESSRGESPLLPFAA